MGRHSVRLCLLGPSLTATLNGVWFVVATVERKASGCRSRARSDSGTNEVSLYCASSEEVFWSVPRPMAPCPLSLTIFRSTLGQIQRYAIRSTALKHCSFTPRPYPLHLVQNLQSVAATVHRPASPKYNTHTNLFRFRSAQPRFRCPQQKRRLIHCQHNKSINRAVISNLPFN